MDIHAPTRLHRVTAQPQHPADPPAQAAIDITAIAPPLRQVMADPEGDGERCCLPFPTGDEGDCRVCCMFAMGSTATMGYSIAYVFGCTTHPAWAGYLVCGISGLTVGNLASRECCRP